MNNALIRLQDEGRARGATCIRSVNLEPRCRDNGAAGLLTVFWPLRRRPAQFGRRVGRCLVCLPLYTTQRLSARESTHLFPGWSRWGDYTFVVLTVKRTSKFQFRSHLKQATERVCS